MPQNPCARSLKNFYISSIGCREKRGLEYFLQEGGKLTEEAVPNDVCEATMTMYRKQKVAKTFQMTKAFIEGKLRADVPHLFCYSSSGASEVVMKKKEEKQKTLKRLADFAAACPGADPGGGSWGSGPPPFGGPPNFIKREKTSRACARKGRVLVLNSYLDPPLSKILYPPLLS